MRATFRTARHVPRVRAPVPVSGVRGDSFRSPPARRRCGLWGGQIRPGRAVPANTSEVQGLAPVPVSDPAHREILQDVMAYEHPHGAGPLAGRQVRYLLRFEHG